MTAGEPGEPVVAPLLGTRATLPANRFPIVVPQRVLAGAARAVPSVVIPMLEKLGGRDRPDGVRDVRVRVQAGPTASRIYVYADNVTSATVGGVRFRVAQASAATGRRVRRTARRRRRAVTARRPLTRTVVALYGSLPADAGAPALPPGAGWVEMSALAGQSFTARDSPL